MGRSLGVCGRRARRGAGGLAGGSGLTWPGASAAWWGFASGFSASGFAASWRMPWSGVLPSLAGGVAIPACVVLRAPACVSGFASACGSGFASALASAFFASALTSPFAAASAVTLPPSAAAWSCAALRCAGRRGSLFGRLQRGERIDRGRVAGCRGGGFAGGRESAATVNATGSDAVPTVISVVTAGCAVSPIMALRAAANSASSAASAFSSVVVGGVRLVRAGGCGGFLAGHGGLRGFIGRAGLRPWRPCPGVSLAAWRRWRLGVVARRRRGRPCGGFPRAARCRCARRGPCGGGRRLVRGRCAVEQFGKRRGRLPVGVVGPGAVGGRLVTRVLDGAVFGRDAGHGWTSLDKVDAKACALAFCNQRATGAG